MADVLQWAGCIFGLTGAFLLALNNRYSGYGFYLFLISNAAWIAFAMLTSVQALSVQNIGFTLTSLLGIYRWRKSVVESKAESRKVS
jgi:nicotinamide riboside transporter PnuC